MSDAPIDPTTSESRFEAAAAEYLRAREEGRAPDAEQFLQRFPELAPRLREFFADQALFDRLAPDLASTPSHPPAAGRRVQMAGYEILEELGRGGMGVVYRARHQKLGHEVALKIMLAGSHASEQELARFHLEAAAVARLKHPGIVHIHDFGEHDGRPFFSLELVEGGSLAARLKAGPLPAREAAALMEKLARAMAHAHDHGIVHRDLKPANVLLTAAGVPKIADFGLARPVAGGEDLTQSGAILGTPSYMAPEQTRPGPGAVSAQTDVYALGALLYELLTGRPPFKAATPLDTLIQVATLEPVPPRRPFRAKAPCRPSSATTCWRRWGTAAWASSTGRGTAPAVARWP